MTRGFSAAIVALVLAGDATATAQQRVSRGAASHPATRTPATTTTGSRADGQPFTSRLTFEGHRVRPGTTTTFRGVNRTVFVSGFSLLGMWGAVPFDVGAPVTMHPLTEDAPIGGVQLDVVPWRARVYVDGVHVGRVDDFTGYYHPLDVASGPHQIVIVDEGYQPLVLDVVVPAGRTTTYRGTLSEALAR